MKKSQESEGVEIIKRTNDLLQTLVALELWRGGLSQAEIGKRLGIAAGSVNKLIKGVSRARSLTVNSK
jgi:predicted transcriptional regulator